VTVALDRPGGPELVRRLSEKVDVFLTNLIQQRRVRYGLTWDDLRAVNPRVIYASFSGYGTRGPDENRPGFDYAAFWARSGLMGLLGEPPSPPPLCRGGQGDHTTALNILAAVLAALRVRDKTDAGQHVEVTLQGTGMWTLAGDLQAALIAREQPARHVRTAPANPIWNSYRARDDKWLLLVMPQPDPYWPHFCAMIGRPAWTSDPRYDSLFKRREHTVELTAEIDRLFAEHDLAHWAATLDAHGLIWAPVASPPRRDRRPAGARDGLLHDDRSSDARHLRDARHAVSHLRRRRRRARSGAGTRRAHLRRARGARHRQRRARAARHRRRDRLRRRAHRAQRWPHASRSRD
jgi:crotonobetainyl-CoA:carnitine CoA-transferase CaiB-like acyl-CoA transferase